ncbi:MATE family efflux transporter [Proteinivorax hydrogeniformans]|uniref:Multidrug export protein MepA n=1 Tax=Proteinivorax hydrogeniformans TaxID=1826727 RepID=A0AAU8HUM1_9FIRM
MKQEQNLTKLFLKYAIPSISALWFFSIYTMIDGIFVGRGVGPLGLAAVNLSMPFITTVFAVALLVAVGSSTLITFYLGKGNQKISDNIFTLNFIILLVFGIALTTLSLLFLEELALILGATQETLPYVLDYLKIIVLSSTFFMIAYSLEVLVKADGFPALSIIVVVLAAIVNIFLDYLLVIRLNYGMQGAAIATGTSQFISFVAFLAYFIFGNSQLKFIKPKIQWSLIRRIISIGTPESLNELSAGFTVFVFNFVIARAVGAEGLASFGVIMYINSLVVMTMIGINQGIQPIISFYNGKNETKPISKILSLAIKTSIGFCVMFFAISQLFTEQVVSLFIDSKNTDIYMLSVNSLRLFSFGFLLSGFNIITSGYFTALRKTKKATIISLLRGYLVVTISVFVLPFIFGELGIWLAPFFYEGITLFFTAFLFWKDKEGFASPPSLVDFR